MRTKLIIFGILVWITLKLSCNGAVEFKFTNAVCESYNKSWMVINHFRLHAISRNKTVFNFNGTVLYPCNTIFVEAQIFKKANGYKPWLFKATVDAILVYNLFKKFTNVNHTCPYMGDQIIDGFYLRPELLGLTMPTGDYLLAMTWLFNKKKTFITNIYFAFKEDL